MNFKVKERYMVFHLVTSLLGIFIFFSFGIFIYFIVHTVYQGRNYSYYSMKTLIDRKETLQYTLYAYVGCYIVPIFVHSILNLKIGVLIGQNLI